MQILCIPHSFCHRFEKFLSSNKKKCLHIFIIFIKSFVPWVIIYHIYQFHKFQQILRMSDIININIGQAGIRIGDHFWQILRRQHFIGQKQPQGNAAFFQQRSKSWEARSIFIDTDDRQLNRIIQRKDAIYNDEDFIKSNTESKGIYAEGIYNIFPQIKYQIMDKIRKRLERCNHFGGFLVFSSLGGGASSGVGMGTIRSMRQEYPYKMLQTVKLFPNLNISNPIQIYNSAFSIQLQVENTDITMLFDNASILRVLSKSQSSTKLTIDDQNQWIANSIAQSTIPYRFAGSLNTNQRKIASNLILFPRMHFFPFSIPNKFTMSPLVSALKPENLSLSDYYKQGGRVFNLYAGVHDHLAYQQQIHQTIINENKKNQISYLQWIPNTFHMSIHPPVQKPSATILVNSQNMRRYFFEISQKFTASFRRRAHMCWYTGVGLDQFEFTQIESYMNDIVSEYPRYDPYDGQSEQYSQNQYAQ